MKKGIRFRYIAVWIFCLLLTVFSAGPVHTRAAVYGELGNGKKMYAWPLKKAELTVYSDEAMTAEAEKVSYREYEILQISGDAAKVRYTSDEGKKKGYVPVKKFIYNTSYQRTGAFVARNAGMYLYKTPSVSAKQKYVSVSFRSGGITLGVKGKYVQMMMTKKGHFYLGWVPFRTFKKTIYRSALHSDQILADGMYTLISSVKGKGSPAPKKYKLKYQGNGLYTLQNKKDKTWLETGKEKNLKLVRNGAYFYIRSADETLGLNGQGKTVKAKNVKKQRWILKKVYAVPTKKKAVIFSQYDPEIGSAVYQNGYDGPRTISSSGCGLMSLVNAIYALNGEYIPPKELAKFSVSRGHYFYNSGTADTLYPDVAGKWGKTYHFRYAGFTTSFHTLRKHLLKKGTAVSLVPGHYIAIVAYRKSDKKYLVLDSAVSGSRPTSIYGDWKSESELQSGRLTCAHFHLFSGR